MCTFVSQSILKLLQVWFKKITSSKSKMDFNKSMFNRNNRQKPKWFSFMMNLWTDETFDCTCGIKYIHYETFTTIYHTCVVFEWNKSMEVVFQLPSLQCMSESSAPQVL